MKIAARQISPSTISRRLPTTSPRCSATKPDQPDILLERAKSFAGDKKYNPAVDDLNKAIELKPDMVEAYLERGDVFSQVRRYDDAIADYSRAIELAPQDAKAYAMLAEVKLRKDPPEVPKPQAELVVAKQQPAADRCRQCSGSLG